MEFQIKQKWPDGAGWIYFRSDETDIEKLKQLAIKETQNDWYNVNPSLYFSVPNPCNPTIYVTELDDDKPKKDLITFKAKWR